MSSSLYVTIEISWFNLIRNVQLLFLKAFEEEFIFWLGDLDRSNQEEEECKTEIVKHKQQVEVLKQQLMLAGKYFKVKKFSVVSCWLD